VAKALLQGLEMTQMTNAVFNHNPTLRQGLVVSPLATS